MLKIKDPGVGMVFLSIILSLQVNNLGYKDLLTNKFYLEFLLIR